METNVKNIFKDGTTETSIQRVTQIWTQLIDQLERAKIAELPTEPNSNHLN